jgi:hypothetical protein
MNGRTRAIIAGAALLLTAFVVGVTLGRKPKSGKSPKEAPPMPTGRPTAPDGGKLGIPDLGGVAGSCTQEDEHGQICTDYFASGDELASVRLKCRKGKTYAAAVWSDAPCDHAASHGGCWPSRQKPTRIRWFYGNLHKDFKPGPDTHRVCGAYSLAFMPDGTPAHVVEGDRGGPPPDGAAGPADEDAGAEP